MERVTSPAPTLSAPTSPYRPDPAAPRVDSADTVRIGDYDVPRLALGCMRLVADNRVVNGTLQWAAALPERPDERRSVVLDAIHACGVGHLDLARGYGPTPGAGEEQLRAWLGGALPRGVLVASKVGYVRTPALDWELDLTPARLASDIEDSARELGGPVPLMYLLVNADATVPVRGRPRRLADALEPLVRAREQGRIRHIGLANVTLEELEELRHVAPIAAVQSKVTLATLAECRPLIDRCGELGIPFVAWGIMGETQGVHGSAFVEAAQRLGITPEQLTIAAILRAGPHVSVLPGPSRRETLYACVRAANVELPDDLVARLVG